jgi:hypothetical protein
MSLEFLPDSRSRETGRRADFLANLFPYRGLEPHLK